LPDIAVLELRSKPVSSSSLLEILVSNQIKWTLVVRMCRADGHFSSMPDASLDVTTLLSLTNFMDMIMLAHDMNGDGCSEVIVRTDPSELEIYYSSPSGPLYTSGRMQVCRVSTQGRPVVRDLNGDGLADIYVVSFEKGELGLVCQQPTGAREP
jgi:hypothetical protein